ncbi:3-hydroxyacyl-CoA dehydrogenase NAD-binding domain-containing protein [Rhodococcus wratislaviensis]|uniref:3-hydroxyacyl-CoA dehydrogenase NAD-binding domain-containing protein n=1 Tax=Rhodococcus wratislaviensis TaxID=44752 RepID=UPI00364E829B
MSAVQPGVGIIDGGIMGAGIVEAAARAALSRISAAPELSVLGEQSVIVEAVPEIEELELDLFAPVDEIARPDALLATNTSSIPMAKTLLLHVPRP